MHMETATAATSAADRQAAEHRQQAGRRMKELAAHLGLHSGFAEVVASLQAGHGGTLGGVWGSSRALVAAALAKACPGPLVVVAPHFGEIDAIERDLALFTDLPVSVFPAWESEPGERVLHDEIFGERLRVLKELGDCPLFLPTRVVERKSVQQEKGTVPLDGGQGEGVSPLFPKAEKGDRPRSSILVTSIQSLLQPVPSPEALAKATREICVGGQLDEEELTRWLVEHGAHATTAVELPGEFSRRGGILDIFAPDAEDPVRIELFGDEVESIRRFDVATQRSLETLQSTTVTMLEPTASDRAHFTSYLPHVAASLRDADGDANVYATASGRDGKAEGGNASLGETRPRGAWFMLIEPSELQEEGKFYLERMERPQSFHALRPTLEEIYRFPSVTASGVPAGSMETTAHLEFESVERFSGEISKVRDELEKVSAGSEVYIVCETEAEVERLG